jgi:hypothetical protein
MKKLVLSAALLACPLPAIAATINGQLIIFPSASYDAPNITFNLDGAGALTPYMTGDFASFFSGANQLLIMQNFGTPIPYTSIGSGSNLNFCGSTCVFGLLNYNGTVDAAHYTGLAAMAVLTTNYNFSVPGVAVQITGLATMTLPGFDPTTGFYNISIQTGHFRNPEGEYYDSWTALAWTDPPTAVPIPAVGLPGSLMLLAGGGVLGWWRRRQDNRSARPQPRTASSSNLPCGSDCLYLIGGKDGRTLAALGGVEDRPLSRDDDR